MTSSLADLLHRLEGRSFSAYKDLRGRHALGELELFVDHVQGDPFAAPSRVRVRIPMRVAELPAALFASRTRRIALEDFLAREIRSRIGPVELRGSSTRGGSRSRDSRSSHSNRREERSGSGKSGLIAIDAGGQQVIERSAVRIDDDWVEARLEVGLPAAGRRILGRRATELLCVTLPEVVRAGLCWPELRERDRDADAAAFVLSIQNQEYVRGQLPKLGLIAFVGNGALLPRRSGASDAPLAADRAVRFESPPALEVRIPVPNPTAEGGSEWLGMGIPCGVTLIAGGGYHGKSTLLRALERAVYPHVPGDGRERVVSDPALVKIRAEDGRRVERVDIHGFIGRLPTPGGAIARDPRCFSSDDASGSTSQAANIIEAIEVGARGLLIDEDTSATNFMVRDARMQALVAKEHEPITPFVERVRELHDDHDVSTILVMGGCGDYFDVADRVLTMRDYQIYESSEEAREIAQRFGAGRIRETREPMGAAEARCPEPRSFDASSGRRDVKISARERDLLLYGRETLDLRGVSQLVDWSQTRAIGLAIHLAASHLMGEGTSLAHVLDQLDALLDEQGLDVLDPFAGGRATGRHPGNLARPRRFEVAAAINRLRTLRVEGRDPAR